MLDWLKKKFMRLYVRIVREKAAPEYIARGWAIGMFYGCVIPFGAQLMLSIPTAFILKGSKVGATLGTLITNHFTIFIIYPFQCFVGARLLGHSQSFDEVKLALRNVLAEQSFESLTHIGGGLMAAFFVGGLLFGIIMTPLTYFSVKKMVEDHRRRKARRKAVQEAIAKK